jgi:ankyrin repeat protein
MRISKEILFAKKELYILEMLPDGPTPKEFAQYTEVSKILLEAGANVNAIDKNGLTPLSWAAKKINIKSKGIFRKRC